MTGRKLPVALIQVKARPLGKEWTPLLRSELKRRPFPPADFLLAIDPVCIHLYRLTEKEPGDPVVHLDTPKVLSHYDPDFTGERIFEHYLLTLVEAWLRRAFLIRPGERRLCFNRLPAPETAPRKPWSQAKAMCALSLNSTALQWRALVAGPLKNGEVVASGRNSSKATIHATRVKKGSQKGSCGRAWHALVHSFPAPPNHS